MTAPAVRPRPHRRLSRTFAYGTFAVMVGGWVLWLLGFPFLVGLALWHAPWDEALAAVRAGTSSD